VIFLLLCVLVAVAASRSRWVRGLDRRLLGASGVVVALWVWSALLAAATAGSVIRATWPLAALFAAMTCWVGAGAYRRTAAARRAAE